MLIRLSVYYISFFQEYVYVSFFMIISLSLSGHNRFFKPALTGAEQHVPLSWLLIWNKAYPKHSVRIGQAQHQLFQLGWLNHSKCLASITRTPIGVRMTESVKPYRWSFSLEEISFRPDSGVNVPKCIPHMLIRFKYIHQKKLH